jgi:hypothetical protein
VSEVDGIVSLARFVEAFYTTVLFRIERMILKWLFSWPSTDQQVRELATARATRFAAWRVTARTDSELLLTDVSGRTSSWFMIEPIETQGLQARTRLYFGSAIAPGERSGHAVKRRGLANRALLGFHKLYSVLLLAAARSRIE